MANDDDDNVDDDNDDEDRSTLQVTRFIVQRVETMNVSTAASVTKRNNNISLLDTMVRQTVVCFGLL